MILDASAILAALYGEPGGDFVDSAIAAGSTACSVNLAEVVTVLIRKGTPEEVALEAVRELPITTCGADLDLSLLAGRLYSDTKQFGLSLGDRFCLALALRESRPAVTSQRVWKDVGPILGVDVRLIR